MDNITIQHNLVETKTQKVINLTLSDKKLISETGKPGKTRVSEKEFSTSEEALKNFTKKEWGALKKGFILSNKSGKIGEPILHKFIGGGYTGALSFQDTPKGIFIYKNIEEIDYLVLIDNLGNVIEETELPKQLAWDIDYRSETNSLLLDLNHFIFEYHIENNSFINLGSKKNNWTSFISVAKDKTAFATVSKIFIADNQNNILCSISYDTEVIKGNTPFSGKLSQDGKLLAFHNKVGEIQIIDANNGNLLSKVVADFQMVERIEFAT